MDPILHRYSQDDIKVSPTTAFAYLQETKQVEELTGKSPAEDYNVGIVRYEYNYPPGMFLIYIIRKALGIVRYVLMTCL